MCGSGINAKGPWERNNGGRSTDQAQGKCNARGVRRAEKGESQRVLWVARPSSSISPVPTKYMAEAAEENSAEDTNEQEKEPTYT